MFKNYNLAIIKDELKGYLGPLAGIHAAFNWLKINMPHIEWLVSVPGDTPFLPINSFYCLSLSAERTLCVITCLAF